MLAILLLLLMLPLAAFAQRWGIQGDYMTGKVPEAIIEKINDLQERPVVDANSYNTGLVRFHVDGSPSWTLEFTRMRMTLNGARDINAVHYELHAEALLRGVLMTKYLNFFSTRYASGGLAFGGGAAQVDANYIRFNTAGLPEAGTRQLWVPAFQMLAQVDIRPVRWISLSPFYGMRNGVVGAGGAVRIHFTR